MGAGVRGCGQWRKDLEARRGVWRKWVAEEALPQNIHASFQELLQRLEQQALQQSEDGRQEALEKLRLYHRVLVAQEIQLCGTRQCAS